METKNHVYVHKSDGSIELFRSLCTEEEAVALAKEFNKQEEDYPRTFYFASYPEQ
jgi:hypothetical protein